jgi:hypothetical protein
MVAASGWCSVGVARPAVCGGVGGAGGDGAAAELMAAAAACRPVADASNEAEGCRARGWAAARDRGSSVGSGSSAGSGSST